MSWAARLARSKDEKVEFGEPKVVVYAKDPSLTDEDRRLFNVEHDTVTDITLPEFSKGLLILDANAIIKGMDNFNSIADAFVTTPQVLGEIRDKASRALMERLPHALTVLDPTTASIREVVHMAERTGDLGVLSRTDIRLCALALDCCKAGGVPLDVIEPRPAEVNPLKPSTTDATTAAVTTEADPASATPASGTRGGGVRVMEEAISDDELENAPSDDGDDTDESNPEPVHRDAEEGDHYATPADAADEETVPSGVDDPDAGDWITPENIHELAADGTRNARGALPFDGGMACATSDFAMQNTLMHLGVPLMGTNGMRIHELRLWLLRCTCCFKLVVDTTRQFCPNCGSGDTLRRVNYVVNSDGERQLFINFRKHISTRGTIYSLPKPRGGKHGTNRTLVLREDQLAQVIRGRSGAKEKERQAISAFDDDELAGFGEAPVKHRRNLAEPKSTSSYHRYNVNEKRKQRAARRK